MKKYIYFILLISIIGCDSESTGDCFQTAGEILKQEIEVSDFDKIVVHENIQLFVEEGPIQKVEIETGKNLMPEILVNVIDGELILTNENTCNFVRDYNLTKVIVTSPNLTTIRNASELPIYSIGVLTYPQLYLRSTGEKGNFLSVGDFHLNIENQQVRIWGNGIATFFLEGFTIDLYVNFSNGDTRFEGKDFIANNIDVQNTSSNDMLVHPLDEITGAIRSTGDVVSYNIPLIIEVEQPSVGKLIFK